MRSVWGQCQRRRNSLRRRRRARELRGGLRVWQARGCSQGERGGSQGGQGAAGPWLTPALLPHSSPAKEVVSPASLVNGVQPSKHENGFSGTEGSQELLELSHHGSSPGSIMPFGDKEPFLKQAVVKPPQVTGERRGVRRGRGPCHGCPGLTAAPSLCPQRCCEGQALADGGVTAHVLTPDARAEP